MKYEAPFTAGTSFPRSSPQRQPLLMVSCVSFQKQDILCAHKHIYGYVVTLFLLSGSLPSILSYTWLERLRETSMFALMKVPMSSLLSNQGHLSVRPILRQLVAPSPTLEHFPHTASRASNSWFSFHIFSSFAAAFTPP